MTCKRCGAPRQPFQVFCGAACSALWESENKPSRPVKTIILTAFREGVEYVTDTIASIYRSGIHDIEIMHDYDRRGDLFSFRDVLEKMVNHYPGHDLLFFEDDVELSKGAGKIMLQTRVPVGAAFVTWYDGKRMPKGSYRIGDVPTLNIVPFDGNLWCMIAQRWAAEMLPSLLHRWPVQADGTVKLDSHVLPVASHRGMDTVAGRICEGLGSLRYAIALPNLAQHTGEVSSYPETGWTLQHKGRLANNYMGPEYDASDTRYDLVRWRNNPKAGGLIRG